LGHEVLPPGAVNRFTFVRAAGHQIHPKSANR
jgi:hypothetical protein